jgi:hypothetical protein
MFKISLRSTDNLLQINKLCNNKNNLKKNYKFLKPWLELYKRSYKKYKYYKKIELKLKNYMKKV